ncbi:MAG TPA: DUF6795 domain-containing protein [Caulifigura sp.]|nr:DUF6795 domain-containing protein [Caulifigura sp.]
MRELLVVSTFICLFQCGCSGESFPEVLPVTGVVTHEGKPVAEATVNLIPTSEKGKSASGVTDADGKFAVKTYMSPTHTPEGAMSGDYLITVQKMLVPEPPAGMTQWEVQAWSEKAGKPRSLLPKKYQSPEKSGLKLTVGTTPPEPLSLDLVD